MELHTALEMSLDLPIVCTLVVIFLTSGCILSIVCSMYRPSKVLFLFIIFTFMERMCWQVITNHVYSKRLVLRLKNWKPHMYQSITWFYFWSGRHVACSSSGRRRRPHSHPAALPRYLALPTAPPTLGPPPALGGMEALAPGQVWLGGAKAPVSPLQDPGPSLACCRKM